ncbi:hypothetical protein LSAT2_022168, partial [Lamellibrachia satsuma]
MAAGGSWWFDCSGCPRKRTQFTDSPEHVVRVCRCSVRVNNDAGAQAAGHALKSWESCGVLPSCYASAGGAGGAGGQGIGKLLLVAARLPSRWTIAMVPGRLRLHS